MYSIPRLSSRSVRQRLRFGLTPIRGRPVAPSWFAVRRTAIHVIARLAVAAASSSSAAAFDATHISRITGVIASRGYSLEHRRHEGRPNLGRPLSAVARAPTSVMADPGSFAKSQSASQPEIEVQRGESEELGKR